MSAPGSARWRLAGLGLIVLGAATLALALTALRHPPALPAYGTVPDFMLTERSGRSVRLADLAGKVWVADFIFTSCGGPCPMMSQRMASIQKGVRALDGVQLVSFSVDPRRDTPVVLREYAERYAADPERWWFLTGEPEAVLRLVRDGFHLAVEVPQDPATEVIHSTRFALVDPRGQVRGYYDGTDDAEVRRLLMDVERLLEED